MLKRIEAYLKERLGSVDPAVMRAFEIVPRDYYHYDYAARRAEPGEDLAWVGFCAWRL